MLAIVVSAIFTIVMVGVEVYLLLVKNYTPNMLCAGKILNQILVSNFFLGAMALYVESLNNDNAALIYPIILFGIYVVINILFKIMFKNGEIENSEKRVMMLSAEINSCLIAIFVIPSNAKERCLILGIVISYELSIHLPYTSLIKSDCLKKEIFEKMKENFKKIATKKNIFYAIIPLVSTLLFCILNRFRETVQHIGCGVVIGLIIFITCAVIYKIYSKHKGIAHK